MSPTRMLSSILIASTMAIAQDVSLRGVVKTSTNAPLKDVVVTLASSSAVTDTTDSNGVFILARKAGGTGITSQASHRASISFAGKWIHLSLDKDMPVSIDMFSPEGRRLAQTWNRTLPGGIHRVPLPLATTSSRLLLVRVQIGDQVETYRMFSDMGTSRSTFAPSASFRTLDQADTLIFSRTDLGTLKMPIQSTTSSDTIKVRTTSISGILSDSGTGSGGTYKVGLFTNDWYWDWAPGTLLASTSMDTVGAYQIDKFIPSGNYYLMAYRDADKNGEYTYDGEQVDPMNEYSLDPVALTSAGLSGANIHIVPRTISGKVTGAPEGWKIIATGPGVDKSSTKINADGSYTLTLYRQGLYGVGAYDTKGAASVAYPNNPIDLREPHRAVVGIDMSVSQNVTISGTLTDLSNDTVGLYKIVLSKSNWYWDGASTGVVVSLLTPNKGSYSITGTIPDGKYYLMAYRDADKSGSYTYDGMAVDPMGEYSIAPVEITSKGLTGADITIVPRAISGKVVGAPSGWQIKATGPGVDQPTTTIAADGSYTLNIYRSGTYTVTAYDPQGAATLPYPNPIDLTGSNTTARNIDMSFGSPITISGTLRDSSPNPTGPYKVALFTSNWYWDWSSGHVVASTTIPSAGPFSMSGIVPDGKYYLMAYHDADSNRSFTYMGNDVDPMGEYSVTAITIDNNGLDGADISIVPRTISGKVAGVPSGWKVRARGPGVDEPTADIAADGSYALKLYRAGSYSITAYDPGGAATIEYPSNPVDLTGASRTATNIDITSK